jgi:riboflavin synthase
MFTGIVQGTATVAERIDKPGLASFRLAFERADFTQGLAVGASVATDGVCLTVTSLHDAHSAWFDVMQQTLSVTTLSGLKQGGVVNVERAAQAHAEIGGHALSGHVDTQARLVAIDRPDNNHVMHVHVGAPWMRYLFAKGYVALNGASLTIAQAERHADGSGRFSVWLIPETLRMTTFANKQVGDALNVEIERSTQVMVDTVREAVAEKLGPLTPVLEQLMAERGLSWDGGTSSTAPRIKS